MKKNFISSKDLNLVFGSDLKVLNITGAEIDSRNVKRGNIFFALDGKKNNGHDFLRQVEKKGASLAIVKRRSNKIKIPQIKVSNTHTALIKLAKYYRSLFKGKIIGITGSVGKTSTKDSLHYILSKSKKTYCSRKSFNNNFGLPLEILNMPKETEVGIFELGMNHKNEIKELSKIAKPEIAIILNVHHVHSKNFNSLKEIALAKSEIFTEVNSVKTLIINRKIKNFSTIKSLANKKSIKDVITFGDKKNSDIFITKKKRIRSELLIETCIKNLSKISYRINQEQEILEINLLAIIGTLSALRVNLALIKRIKDLHLTEGRGETKSISFKNKRLKITDHAYNASPVSMSATIKYFSAINKKNKIFIIGDMNELGRKSPTYHEQIFKLALSQSFNYCLFIGSKFYKLKKINKEKNVVFFYNVEQLLEKIDIFIKEDCSIFIKGSNSIKLNKVIEYLN
tara:strand:- start:16 stop:1380 length:1365 start_codon:yes stop_codon:yes gene_type:complete